MMKKGGSAITLSYYGAQKVMPNYNVMGVAKAALEASVKYLAADVGPQNIRVNALSAGPMRTLAGSAIGGARATYRTAIETSPLKRPMTLEDIGGSALYLLSPLSSGVTGETHYVDGGYNVMGMKKPENGNGDGE
jgi:enoyl-[acyl-carrier protein] reductase I